ncbi:hypothetical protein A2U01_0113092, partial [Trifolium medium]|nr:hypothetical protein [Trifolium medium]
MDIDVRYQVNDWNEIQIGISDSTQLRDLKKGEGLMELE